MSISRTATASLASALGVLGVQIVALVALEATKFGYFSAVYLLSALTLSLGFSVVCDAWVRAFHESPRIADDWRSYGAASLWISLLGAVATGLVAALIPPLSSHWWLVALATLATSYRSCARYFSMNRSRWREVLPGDLLGALVTVCGGAWILLSDHADLGAVITLWAVSSLASAAASRWPTWGSPTSLASWVRQHRAQIAPLLRDSLVMDASAIGTPFAMIPLLGVTDFGIYRAVSNVAAPVRLILNPVRPRLVHMPITRRLGIVVAAMSALIGGLAAVALLTLDVLGWSLGTLSQLSPLAVPTGLFVSASLLGHMYYLLARSRVGGSSLLTARLIQTGLGVAGPIVGALTWGLTGAVWLYAVCTMISAVVWTIIVYRNPSTS